MPPVANKISTMAFEVNKAPTMDGLDSEDILKLLHKFKCYMNEFTEAGACMEPRPLKSMIKQGLLKAICRYELKVEENDVRSSQL
jgi:hypothetical protein